MKNEYSKGKASRFDHSQYLSPNKPWTKKKDLDKTGEGKNGAQGRAVGEARRAYGSTHRSLTKDKIKRSGRKRARQEAKKIVEEEL